LPVAIELANRETITGLSGVVYSRAELIKDKREVLWRLAKATFRAIVSCLQPTPWICFAESLDNHTVCCSGNPYTSITFVSLQCICYDMI
jgi:hypothetical protein